LDFVVQAFQLRTHLSECHIDDASNILANDPTGLDLSNNPKHLRPEEAVIFRSLSLSCGREGLTGEAAREEVNDRVSARFRLWLFSPSMVNLLPVAVSFNFEWITSCPVGVGSKPFSRESSDVAIDVHPRKVLSQCPLTETVNFAEADTVVILAPHRLSGESEAADAREEVEVSQLLLSPEEQ